MSAVNTHANYDSDISAEELKRQRRRKQLARKTPEQRRKALQYARRHNEKDGRLFYCDYCDLFISSSQRCWRRHLTSAKHLSNVEGYWHTAAHVESVWLNEINEDIAKAHLQVLHRQYHTTAGAGAATPMPAIRVAPGIIVGGTAPPPMTGTVGSTTSVTIKVGNSVVPPPPVKVPRLEAPAARDEVGK